MTGTGGEPTEWTILRGAWEEHRREQLTVLAELGRGESGRVLLVRLEDGTERALKWAFPEFEEHLLEEARSLHLLQGLAVPGEVELVWILSEGEREHLGVLCEVAQPWIGVAACSPEARESAANQLFVELGASLAQIHRAGFSHGDLKPPHLAHNDQGRLLLLDFGLSGSAGARQILGGTPRYLAPEVFSGSPTTGAAADVYSWALLIAETVAPESVREGPTGTRVLPLPAAWETRLRPFLAERPGLRAALAASWEPDQTVRGQEEARLIRQTFLEVHEESWRELVRQARRCPQIALSEALRTAAKSWVLFWAVYEKRREVAEGAEWLLPVFSQEAAARFWSRLLGPVAWELSQVSEGSAAQVDTLLTWVKERPLAHFALQAQEVELSQSDLDPVRAALWLGRRPLAHRDLVQLAEQSELHPELRRELARALRRRGDFERARLLLEVAPEDADWLGELVLERMRLEQAAGSTEQAALLARAALRAEVPQLRAVAASFLARREYERGEPAQAAALLEGQLFCVEIAEMMSLLALAEGQIAQAREPLMRVQSGSFTEEERARIEALWGMIAHAEGRPEQALRWFQRAAERVEDESAWLEQAVYWTGAAAAATDAGETKQALAAAERAALLFESLGKKSEEAHALLARAAVLAQLGAEAELRQVARRALRLVRETGDERCAGYVELCVADGVRSPEERLQAAERAAAWLRSGSRADQWRAAARLLECGASVSEQEGDEKVEQLEEWEVRLEWWKARAVAWQNTREAEEGKKIIQALLLCAGEERRSWSLGPAWVAGAQVALQCGEGELARRWLRAAQGLSQNWAEQLPAERRLLLEELPWVSQVRSFALRAEEDGDRWQDMAALLQALGQREGLRDLFRKILDVLLLWTQVERGLLLVRAPGDRLVVRGARNIRRVDLTEEQLALSRSLAEQALAEGRTVVARDATRDLARSHQSVHALSLRSVLAVPLRARGETFGVAYLDDRSRRGAFGPRELAWVELIAQVAALAIADERDRLQLRRAVRRAELAEARLARQLSERETELVRAERELAKIRESAFPAEHFQHIVGTSPALRHLLALVERVAASEVPVLIWGESGTGKELIARAIVERSARRGRPFLAENCAAVPEALLESTLFGHSRGAFTGAERSRAGLFELADGGTLLLDEIAEMSLAMQAKLLRVLQEGELWPVGAERPKRVDVRILGATHRDLEERVAQGLFREDLFYRLHVVSLHVPALRERREDIVLLAQHFLQKHSGGAVRRFSPAVLERFERYSWPGNVRQLENEVRRLLVLGGRELTWADLSPEVRGDAGPRVEGASLKEQVDAFSRRLILQKWQELGGNRSQVAAQLGLSRFGLQKMMRRLEMEEQLASGERLPPRPAQPKKTPL